MSTHSIRADFSLEALIKDHPILSALTGIVALNFAWNAVSGIIEWSQQVKPREDLKNKKLPIVYSSGYNMYFLGIEKILHSFDAQKYRRVHDHLIAKLGIPHSSFYEPKEISIDDLKIVHDADYIEALENTDSARLTASIAEVPIGFLPNFVIRNRILKPMKLATGGTVLGAQLAMGYGEHQWKEEDMKWAINIGGGYHHAKGKGHFFDYGKYKYDQDEGHGFCIYGDIQLAIEKLWKKNPNLKVMIVDLDAHQGNGHEAYFATETAKLNGQHRVVIFDMYNEQNWYPPEKLRTDAHIQYKFGLAWGTKDAQYLKILTDNLPRAIEEFNPDFILYNAGTDIFEHDPLGKLKISHKGIIQRDQFVFEQAQKYKKPILMVTSGGYTQQSAVIIGESIENLLKKVIKVIN